MFLVVISLFAQTFKRLRDLGKSSLWVFVILLPFGNLILYLYLASTPGDKGTNKYGSDPLEETPLS